MPNDNVIAIVPARSGSKGVPGKNIALLAGYPLIAYSIAVAKMSNLICRVFLSTDSPDYARIGRQYGAETPFLRPPELAEDSSPDRGLILHAIKWIQKNENHVPEYWVHLRPTTPLRDPKIVDDAIEKIIKSKDPTSLRSGHPAPETPFKWFQLDEAGYFRGIRPDDTRPEYYNLPRQCFPTVYVPDGYVDIVRASHVLSSESLHGQRMIGFESPPCTEVDSMQEFEYLEFNLQRHGSPLLDFLNENYSKDEHGR